MTPDHLARIVHDAAIEAAHRAERERQEAARGKLLDPEVEVADCCDGNLMARLVLRGRGQWGVGQIRRLHPDGRVTVAIVRVCPLCETRYDETGA